MIKFKTLNDLLNRPIVSITEALVKFDDPKDRKIYPYPLPKAIRQGRGESTRKPVFDPKTKEYIDPQADPGDIVDLPSPNVARKYAGHQVYQRAADEQDVQYFMLQNVLQNLGLIKGIHRSRRVNISKSNQRIIEKYKNILLSLFDHLKIKDDEDFEKFNNILTYTKTYLDDLAGFNISDMLKTAAGKKSQGEAWDNLIGDKEKFKKLLYTHYFISNFRSKEFHHNANIEIRNRLQSLYGNELSDSEASLKSKINKLSDTFKDDDEDDSFLDELEVTECIKNFSKKKYHYLIDGNALLLEEDENDDDSFLDELEPDDTDEDLFNDEDLFDDEDKNQYNSMTSNDAENSDDLDDIDFDDNSNEVEKNVKYSRDVFKPTKRESEITAAAVSKSFNTLYNVFNSAKEIGFTPYQYNDYITKIDSINTIFNIPELKSNINIAIEKEKADRSANNESFTFDDYKTAVLAGLAMSVRQGKPKQQVSNVVARETTASLLKLVRKFRQLSQSDSNDITEEDKEAYTKGLTLDNIFRYIRTSNDAEAQSARESLNIYYGLSPDDLTTKNFPTFQAFAKGLYERDQSLALQYERIKNIFNKPNRKGAIFQAIKSIDRARDSIIKQKENFANLNLSSAEELKTAWNENKLKIGSSIGTKTIKGDISFKFVRDKLNYELPSELENKTSDELYNTKLFDFSGYTKSEIEPYINSASRKLSGEAAVKLMREVLVNDYEKYFNDIFAPSLIKDITENGPDGDWKTIRFYIRQYISSAVSRMFSTLKFKKGTDESAQQQIQEYQDKLEAQIKQYENVTGQKVEINNQYKDLDFSKKYEEDMEGWPYAIINVKYGIMPLLQKAKANPNLDKQTKEELKSLFSKVKNEIIPESFKDISDNIINFLIDGLYAKKDSIGVTYESLAGKNSVERVKDLRKKLKTIDTRRVGEIQNIIKTIDKLTELRYTYNFTISYKENTDLYDSSNSLINRIMTKISDLIKKQLINDYKEKSGDNKWITDKLLNKFIDVKLDFAINKEYDSEDLLKDINSQTMDDEEEDEEVTLACASIEPDCFERIAKKQKVTPIYNNQIDKYKDAYMRNEWKNEYIWRKENGY